MKKIMYIVILFLMSINALGYINIYPSKFEKSIKKETYEEFTLYNRTQRDIKYRVYLEDIEGKKSMTDWIEVYPKSIVLKPLEEKIIKLSVKAPENAPAGEYNSNLVIKEIESVKKTKNESKVKVMTMLKLKLKGYVD